jgi:hypothetical protein
LESKNFNNFRLPKRQNVEEKSSFWKKKNSLIVLDSHKLNVETKDDLSPGFLIIPERKSKLI